MTEDIGTLSKLINDYGPLIVLFAVFLFLFLIIIIFILNAHKKSIDSDKDINSKLITSLLNDYFRKNAELITDNESKSYDEKNIVNIYMRLNKTLKNVCEPVLEKTHSDRIAIYVFHNGATASHGLPFFKITCITEMISKNSNLNIKMLEHNAVSINLFDSIVSGLYENSEYRIITDETHDPSELVFLKNTKIKDAFFIPIYDDANNMMGFIFNGYNIYSKDRDINKQKELLIALAKTAKPVIEFSKFQDFKVDTATIANNIERSEL